MDREIRFIKEFAKQIVKEGNGFESDKHIVKLFHRGRIMDDGKKLGDYVNSDDTVQIFRMDKPVQ